MPYCFSGSREANSRWQPGKNNITDQWSLTLRGEGKKPAADEFVSGSAFIRRTNGPAESRTPPLGFTSALRARHLVCRLFALPRLISPAAALFCQASRLRDLPELLCRRCLVFVFWNFSGFLASYPAVAQSVSVHRQCGIFLAGRSKKKVGNIFK